MSNINNKLRVFEAFAGIGAQRKALSNINENCEIAGLVEWFVIVEGIKNRFRFF